MRIGRFSCRCQFNSTICRKCGAQFICKQKLHNYLLGKITFIPEPVAVSDSQEVTHHNSAIKTLFSITVNFVKLEFLMRKEFVFLNTPCSYT